MPRTAAQNKAIKDKRKKRLLDIALKTFALKGYLNVTIDDITKAARCSHGLFYHYFSSKDDVFQETVRYFILGSSTPLLTATEMSSCHGVEGLKKFFEIAEGIETGIPQDLYTAKIMLDLERNEVKSDLSKEAIRRFAVRQTFERLIEEGQKTGDVIDGDPKDISSLFFDLIIGVFDCLLSGNQSLKKPISKSLFLSLVLKRPL